MSDIPHFIQLVERHESFNDTKRHWGPQRLNNTIPSRIAVFQPIGSAPPALTRELMKSEFGVRTCTIVRDLLYGTTLTFLSTPRTVRAVADKAHKLSSYKIFPLDENYPPYHQLSKRLRKWILQQAHPSSPIPDTTPPRPTSSELQTLEGLIALSDNDGDNVRVSDVSNDSFSNDNDDDDKNNDKDHQEDEDGNTTSSSPLPSQIAQLTPKNFFGRYNLHILTILKVLLATAPAAVRSDPQLLKYVHPTRPLQNRGYDVDMEGALWKGISQCRKLQRATGGTTLLNPVYKAIKVAWYDLDLGEWPYHVQ